MSVLGIAREVAALTGATLREPDLSYAEDGDPVEGVLNVEIADPALCPRYTASVIRDIRVGPSPRWMQDRLAKAGQRSINNVVDMTNYVMLEFGQPLHAFDFDTIAESRIVVRPAGEQEPFVTLDEAQHHLRPPMLVIADGGRSVALAGIMGGLNTEMTDATTSVLLESANFNPVNTRRTSQALRLRSESSSRFEKGAAAGARRGGPATRHTADPRARRRHGVPGHRRRLPATIGQARSAIHPGPPPQGARRGHGRLARAGHPHGPGLWRDVRQRRSDAGGSPLLAQRHRTGGRPGGGGGAHNRLR